MVNFTIEQIRNIMDKQQNIRNMSVIAHVDHGKSTLTDSLICKAGIISSKNAGQFRYTDNRQDQKERGITIKSTGVSLYYQYDFQQNEKHEHFLINLIDSPGHVDFSSQVTAALRVTDGALVVVDCVEGVCIQTQTVLRQAMQEKIKPVLIVNKIDRNILQLKLDGQAMYQNFVRVIDMVNVIISTYQQDDMGQLMCQPSRGNVAFGSGKQQWAFTLTQFAKMYSKKFNSDFNKMMQKLWGDNFFDPETKKWKKQGVDQNGKSIKRAFVNFVMDPICKLCNAIMEGQTQQCQKMITSLGIPLTQQEKHVTGKAFLKLVMSKWLNAADCLLEMMVLHLPSPKQAQKYRTAYLYEGPQEDQCATAMRKCDPKGPLMIYISKMVPSTDKGRFFAFGRVFSGTVSSGQKVRIMGPNYIPGKKEDIFEKNIQRTVLMMGRTVQYIPNVPCGNTVALVGIDQYLIKTGTISDHPQSYTIRSMKYSVSPVVRVAVKPKNPAELPKLVDGLKKLSKSDPLVVCTTEETGQNVIAGCGQLHVQICLKDLQSDYAQIEIIQSDPIVTYKQTVTTDSSIECLTKSHNKHNRIKAIAEPLHQDLPDIIQKGTIGPKDDPKVRAKILSTDYNWQKDEAMKIWCFGPENTGANMVVDMTKGIQFMNEIRDSMESAFQWASKMAVMTEENMRGIRINIIDCQLHPDSIHRGGGQLIPASRRLYYVQIIYQACQLTANPRLLEPIYNVQITCPFEAMGGVYSCLNQRRGTVNEQQPIIGTPLNLVKSYLPVSESFGFAGALREHTHGKAFPQCVFDHWQVINDDPFVAGSKSDVIVNNIRKRKGLKEGIPGLDNYLDKL